MLDAYQLNYMQQLGLQKKDNTKQPPPTPMAQMMTQFNFIASQQNYNMLYQEYEQLKKRKGDLLRDYNQKLAQNAALNNIPSYQIQGLIDEINQVNSRIKSLDNQLAQY